VFALTKPKWLIYAMIFFAGWHSLFIDVGLMLTIYRLIVIIFLLCLPIYLSLRKEPIKISPSIKYLLIFACYAIVITAIMRFFAPESPIEGFTRGEGRWIFQIAMLLIDITPAFLPLLFFTKIEDVKTAGKVFVISTFILCFLGWIQSLAFYLYRVALFAVPMLEEGIFGPGRVIAVDMFGVTVHRMHSLGGEPKDFAITVAVAIILLIISRIVNQKGFRFGNLLIGFFLMSLFMSLATSGFFVLAMGLVLVATLPFFIKGLHFKSVWKSVAGIAIFLIIFFGVVIGSGILPRDTLKAVIIERIARSPIELFDAAALGFLFTNPQYGLFGVGMGNIHLYAWDYLLQHAMINLDAAWVLPYAHDFVFIPNSGYLEIISELGIIGLFLFLAVFLIPIRFNLKYRRYIFDKDIKDIGLILALFCFFTLVVYLMRFHQINFAFITLGLLYFFNREVRQNFKLSATAQK
jgi:hypothetical protein